MITEKTLKIAIEHFQNQIDYYSYDNSIKDDVCLIREFGANLVPDDAPNTGGAAVVAELQAAIDLARKLLGEPVKKTVYYIEVKAADGNWRRSIALPGSYASKSEAERDCHNWFCSTTWRVVEVTE